MTAKAGEITYDPLEWSIAEAELIVVALQTGNIGEVKAGDGSPDPIPRSRFKILKTIKGKSKEKEILVRSNLFYQGGDHMDYFPFKKNEKAIMHLERVEAGATEWRLVGRSPSMFRLKPDGKGRYAKIQAEVVKLLTERGKDALEELKKYAPDAFNRARALWPSVLAESETPVPKGKPESVLSKEPWSKLLQEEALVIRALNVFRRLEAPVPALSVLVEKRIKDASEADFRAAIGWFQNHFRRLGEPDALAAFCLANRPLIFRFFFDFPPRIWDEVGRPPKLSGQDMVIGINREEKAKRRQPDLKTYNTLYFMIRSEDPGLYDFVMIPSWAYFGRQFSRTPRKRPTALFAPMRMEWIGPRLLDWLKPESDRRLRKVALITLAEHPFPWIRSWVEKAYKKAGKGEIGDLIAVASGLDDPHLALSIWQAALRKKGKEWKVLWWLRFMECFHPSLARFALERWKKIEAEPAQEKKRVPSYRYEAYLTAYARYLGEKEEVRTLSDAERWVGKLPTGASRQDAESNPPATK